jgi:hypothetical protein
MTRLYIKHPAPVRLDAQGRPTAFYFENAWHTIVEIVNQWRVATDWWAGEEIQRDYFKLISEDGLLAVIYKDLLGGEWYMSRLYD